MTFKLDFQGWIEEEKTKWGKQPSVLSDTDVMAWLSAKVKKGRTPKGLNRKERGKKPTPADAGRLARRTAEFLQDHNWTKGSLENPITVEYGIGGHAVVAVQDKPSYCLSGALNKTFCGNARLNRVRVAQIPLLKLTHQLMDEFLGTSIEHWNDTQARSKDEVIEKLYKFADEHDPKKY